MVRFSLGGLSARSKEPSASGDSSTSSSIDATSVCLKEGWARVQVKSLRRGASSSARRCWLALHTDGRLAVCDSMKHDSAPFAEFHLRTGTKLHVRYPNGAPQVVLQAADGRSSLVIAADDAAGHPNPGGARDVLEWHAMLREVQALRSPTAASAAVSARTTAASARTTAADDEDDGARAGRSPTSSLATTPSTVGSIGSSPLGSFGPSPARGGGSPLATPPPPEAAAAHAAPWAQPRGRPDSAIYATEEDDDAAWHREINNVVDALT